MEEAIPAGRAMEDEDEEDGFRGMGMDWPLRVEATGADGWEGAEGAAGASEVL